MIDGDVTVRLPVGFESDAGMAGFVHSALANAMEARGWVGSPFVLFRLDNGEFAGFTDGGFDTPYEGVLPHGLVEA